MLFDVYLKWFDDDQEDTDVEAESLEDAARRVWADWSVTGWTDASVRDPRSGEWIFLNLDAPDYETGASK